MFFGGTRSSRFRIRYCINVVKFFFVNGMFLIEFFNMYLLFIGIMCVILFLILIIVFVNVDVY